VRVKLRPFLIYLKGSVNCCCQEGAQFLFQVKICNWYRFLVFHSGCCLYLFWGGGGGWFTPRGKGLFRKLWCNLLPLSSSVWLSLVHMDAAVSGRNECISCRGRLEGILVNQRYRSGRVLLPSQWEFKLLTMAFFSASGR